MKTEILYQKVPIEYTEKPYLSYVANDGKRFTDKAECEKYDEKLDADKRFEDILKDTKTFKINDYTFYFFKNKIEFEVVDKKLYYGRILRKLPSDFNFPGILGICYDNSGDYVYADVIYDGDKIKCFVDEIREETENKVKDLRGFEEFLAISKE